MTGVGYGDIVPANAFEHLLCVSYMVLSQMFAAKIFADITWITETCRQSKAEYIALLSQTSSVLASMRAPVTLRKRVFACQEFVERQREHRSQDCLQDLSRPLLEELRLLVYYDLVVQAPFLQEQPTYMVRAIIMSLHDLVYLPCDVIVRKGDVGTELFFVRSGSAGVFTTRRMPEWGDQEVHVLHSGSYFGEIAVLTGMTRRSWVVARTYCSCSTLAKDAMDELMAKHPEGLAGLVKSFQNALGLEPRITWTAFGERLHREFADESDLHKCCCAGSDGFYSVADSEDTGCINWERWQSLTTMLHLTPLDAKLLWVQLEPDDTGAVDYEFFLEVIEQHGDQSESDAC